MPGELGHREAGLGDFQIAHSNRAERGMLWQAQGGLGHFGKDNLPGGNLQRGGSQLEVVELGDFQVQTAQGNAAGIQIHLGRDGPRRPGASDFGGDGRIGGRQQADAGRSEPKRPGNDLEILEHTAGGVPVESNPDVRQGGRQAIELDQIIGAFQSGTELKTCRIHLQRMVVDLHTRNGGHRAGPAFKSAGESERHRIGYPQRIIDAIGAANWHIGAGKRDNRPDLGREGDCWAARRMNPCGHLGSSWG